MRGGIIRGDVPQFLVSERLRAAPTTFNHYERIAYDGTDCTLFDKIPEVDRPNQYDQYLVSAPDATSKVAGKVGYPAQPRDSYGRGGRNLIGKVGYKAQSRDPHVQRWVLQMASMLRVRTSPDNAFDGRCRRATSTTAAPSCTGLLTRNTALHHDECFCCLGSLP